MVKICSQHLIPMIPYGSGTSLEGHTTSPYGGVSIDMSRMTDIIAINKDDMDCIVQAGITWNALNEELEKYGLFFSPDPGPGASIGGMVATNCSGTNASRFGPMRQNVISLTVVLPNGEIVKTGNRARKTSAGYALTQLITGSEGTLGIVTQATLRLHTIPEHVAVGVTHFPSIEAAAQAVIEMNSQGLRLGCVELLDEVMIKAVNQYSGLSYPQQPTLFLKLHGGKNTVDDELRRVQQIISRYQASAL